MKKYEISEEELEALIGLAAARTCDSSSGVPTYKEVGCYV